MKRTNHTKRSTSIAPLGWIVLTASDELQFSYNELHSSKSEQVRWLAPGSGCKLRSGKNVTITAILEFSTLAGAKAALLRLSDKAMRNNTTLRQEYYME